MLLKFRAVAIRFDVAVQIALSPNAPEFLPAADVLGTFVFIQM